MLVLAIGVASILGLLVTLLRLYRKRVEEEYDLDKILEGFSPNQKKKKKSKMTKKEESYSKRAEILKKEEHHEHGPSASSCSLGSKVTDRLPSSKDNKLPGSKVIIVSTSEQGVVQSFNSQKQTYKVLVAQEAVARNFSVSEIEPFTIRKRLTIETSGDLATGDIQTPLSTGTQSSRHGDVFDSTGEWQWAMDWYRMKGINGLINPINPLTSVTSEGSITTEGSLYATPQSHSASNSPTGAKSPKVKNKPLKALTEKAFKDPIKTESDHDFNKKVAIEKENSSNVKSAVAFLESNYSHISKKDSEYFLGHVLPTVDIAEIYAQHCDPDKMENRIPEAFRERVIQNVITQHFSPEYTMDYTTVLNNRAASNTYWVPIGQLGSPSNASYYSNLWHATTGTPGSTASGSHHGKRQNANAARNYQSHSFPNSPSKAQWGSPAHKRPAAVSLDWGKPPPPQNNVATHDSQLSDEEDNVGPSVIFDNTGDWNCWPTWNPNIKPHSETLAKNVASETVLKVSAAPFVPWESGLSDYNAATTTEISLEALVPKDMSRFVAPLMEEPESFRGINIDLNTCILEAERVMYGATKRKKRRRKPRRFTETDQLHSGSEEKELWNNNNVFGEGSKYPDSLYYLESNKLNREHTNASSSKNFMEGRTPTVEYNWRSNRDDNWRNNEQQQLMRNYNGEGWYN